MQKKEIAINVENLSKTYKNGVKAISGVSFFVNFGEIFGLLGPNGAGKSSTVRILSTLSNLSDGNAHIAGFNVSKSPTEVRLLMGYVAQSTGVDAWATGKENLLLQAQLERVPRKDINKRVSHLLEWVGLSSVSRKLVNTYSGGMKRRLEIAMGLVHEPKVLFLDEPSTGLDPESRRKLWNDLKYLQKQKKITVLLTTHYLEEADYLCDRIAIIDKGRVVTEGTPSELKSKISSDIVTLEIENEISIASNILKNLNGVNSTNIEGDRIVLQVTNGKKILPSLIIELQRKSIDVNSFSFNSPTLDDVYLKFTGHRFDQDI
ncbi:MAG: Daunorubicin/doxorubicin resistance ATP-binding protein DrrA [Alphaproteobacteria bacterium MarineAlpha2_Bin1]|nr:MAG: Daunorubicin/doxorubicin resistance ATP-binding protein DrrA [Alphaproteobacteria bacterium MarineAlpha2_Bin1]|tara:strand:- start:120 stop:1076 length:957 start_codon:yes stop_codon:yes gene_type:complete